MELVGYPFTSEKRRGTEAWIEVRLNRALVTHGWNDLFPDARLQNLEISASDHCPILLNLNLFRKVVSLKKFRFENAWVREPMCHQIVHDNWDVHESNSLSSKIKCCSTALAEWGKDITGHKTQHKEAQNRLFEVLAQKEVFWKQRSKQMWLQSGDQNTKYFHACASTRHKNNQILSLKNKSGIWVDWENGLPGVIEDYFRELSTASEIDWGRVTACVHNRVSTAMNESLTISVDAEEVRKSLFQMHPDKSPGPDGFNPWFYQKFWDIIVSKVLANQLKIVLPSVISETQSTFLPGRLIIDNILISFEVMHYLKKKQMGREGVLVLSPIQSHRGGGHKIGFIIPTRGLRQGDPLSPDLFLLCAERFSSLIRDYERLGKIRASEDSAIKMIEMLNIFQKASGQQVNLQKSSIFFSANIVNEVRQHLCSMLGVNEAGDDSAYLSLSNIVSRNKMALLGFLEDKMRKRIQGWEGRLLSKAGKELLIKTVAQSLPSYEMNVFLLPVETCNEMEQLMCKFWWRSSKNNKGIHWKKWDRLTVHKSKGGMGFGNLHDFNLSLLCKQGWRLFSRLDSLVSKIFKARYYRNGTFLNAELGSNPSFVWRSIYETQEIVRKGARCRVGDGSRINIVLDLWLPNEDNPRVTSNNPAFY
ncbi:uncharacterized protein LOC133032418 [Cannabis sativa]|uniref:uncharacterized protein LOC133032418 n=1 Tax=Cannabis sativa TaxID=3483 RepID=UPI0029CA016C|nr:uncharacterized protein LOC133032418 [Cannabis sativa]